MEAHGGVLDCHFSWTNLVIYVFFLSWVGKMININLFRRKSSGCLTRVVHKSSWAKFNKTTTCDTTRGNKHKENTTSSRASTSRMRTAEPLQPRWVQSSLSSTSSTQHMSELLAGNRTAVLPRHGRVRWITS